jgi:hypothetical protein
VVYLLLVSVAAGQLSAASTTDTKQQYGGCDPQEVKVYGGCGPHEVNVLRVAPAGCKSTAGVTRSKLRLVRVEPAGKTDFLRGALEPHTPRPAPARSPHILYTDVLLSRASRSLWSRICTELQGGPTYGHEVCTYSKSVQPAYLLLFQIQYVLF